MPASGRMLLWWVHGFRQCGTLPNEGSRDFRLKEEGLSDEHTAQQTVVPCWTPDPRAKPPILELLGNPNSSPRTTKLPTSQRPQLSPVIEGKKKIWPM